ncbi:hypothetical protein Scep_000089 [Stephania cephalantha]|uniref:Glutamate receptor n=1 Tax=Stephania cephalantha TaxID=152367 RepID=A0AAP0L6Y0_9MAGN
MKVLWFLLSLILSLVVFSNGVSSNVSSRPATVNFGAVITFDSKLGRVAKIAIEEAVKDVNSNSRILGGTKLAVKMVDSNASGFIGLIEALQFMKMETVAFIGPHTTELARLMSPIADELQVPLLSYGATDASLSPIQFPFLVRTTQSDLYMMAAISEMIDYYGWKEVIAIYVDDDHGRNGIAALSDKLAERRCRIVFKEGLPPVSNLSHALITNVLVKITRSESRVIVLHTNPIVGLEILSEARHFEMMGSGFVWIATEWLSFYFDSSPSPLPQTTMDTMQGVLTLRQHTLDSERKRDFFSRWRKLTGGTIGLNTYGLYAYDTVFLVAHAIKTYLDQGGTISFSNFSKKQSAKGSSTMHLDAIKMFDGGKQLLRNILQTRFIGLTGPIEFNPERSLIYPSYDIINVAGTGFRRIGYWSNYSGLSVVPPEMLYSKPPNRSSENQRLYRVIWPGDPTVKPRGWVFQNNGKELRIGVPNRVSFREFVTLVKGTDIVKGFCIDVFTAALDLLPYGVPHKFIPYGDGLKNPSYNELVSLITADKFDAVVGEFAIMTNRTKIAEFTQPFAESGLVVVAPYKKLSSDGWAFLRPFSPRMWAVIAAFSLFLGIVVWILEHRINDEFRGPPRKQLITIFCFSFSSLFSAHRENTISTLGRFILLIWLFVVLIINSSYTASLSSILTLQKLYSSVTGIESLLESGDPIGCSVGSYAESYLHGVLKVPKSRLVPLGSPEEYVSALQRGPTKGGVAAVVHERPYMDLFLSRFCNFKIVGQEFTKNGWGFAFRRGSTLAEDVSTAILTLSENGDLQRIREKWLKRSDCSVESELELNRLHFRSFWGLFLTCGIAFLVALLIYFSQIIWKFRKYYPNEFNSTFKGSSQSRRLQMFLSFVNEKEPKIKRRKCKRRQMENSVNIEKAHEPPEQVQEKRN